ncbi:MAG: hypothetical protein ACI4TT_02570, partial [Christensenellales bacterium]
HYVLLQKIADDKFIIVPTEKLINNNIISRGDTKVKSVADAQSTQDLVINKIDKNNRYLHPSHVCYDLHFKKLTPSQLVAFATLVGEIKSDAKDAYEQIKNACEKINDRVIEDYKNEVLAKEAEKVVVLESSEKESAKFDANHYSMERAFETILKKRAKQNSLKTAPKDEETLTK